MFCNICKIFEKCIKKEEKENNKKDENIKEEIIDDIIFL